MKRAAALALALGVTVFAVGGAGARTSRTPPPPKVFAESQSLWGQAFVAGVQGARRIYVRASSPDSSAVYIDITGHCGRIGSRKVTPMKQVLLRSTPPNQVWKMTPVPAHAVCWIFVTVAPPNITGGAVASTPHLVDITMLATGIAGPKTTPPPPTKKSPPGQVYASGYATPPSNPLPPPGVWYGELSTVLFHPSAVYAQVVTANAWVNVRATIDCEGAAPSRFVRLHVRPAIFKIPMPANIPPDSACNTEVNAATNQSQRQPIWLRLSNVPA